MTVASEVRRAVEMDVALGRLLCQGLVNLRATARHLQHRRAVSGPSDAVVSALRRLRHGSTAGRAGELLQQAEIEVTSPVASITIRQAGLEGLGSVDALLASTLQPRWQVHSPQGIRLIVPEKRLDGAEALLLAVPEVQVRRGLAEVAVVLASDARRVPGVLALACQRLALGDVNIVETVDGFGQHTFLVSESQAKDAVAALREEPRKV